MDPYQDKQHNDLLKRKLFHLLAGAIIPLVYLFLPISRPLALKLLFPVLLLSAFLEYKRLLDEQFQQWFMRYLSVLFKKDEAQRVNSAVTMVAACFMTILYFPKPMAIAAMFILNLADPVASMVGIRWGRIAIGKKSLEGSAAFFLVALAVLVCFFPLKLAVPVALLAAIAELLIAPPLDDNFLLPPITGLMIYLAGRLL